MKAVGKAQGDEGGTGDVATTDAVQGEWGRAREAAAAAKRIDWVRGQVTGRRVLVAGRNLGPICVALGREAIEATGVDNSPEVIARAEAAAANEAKAIRGNLRFSCSNLEDIPPERIFDTVVLDGFLEFHDAPTDMVRHAASRLSEGGRLILALPFGFQHRDSEMPALFPSWLRQFSEIGLQYRECEVRDGFLLAAASREAGKAVKALGFQELLELTEAGILHERNKINGIVNEQVGAGVEFEEALLAADTRELALLRELERQLAESERSRSMLRTLQGNIRYRLGHTIIQGCASPIRALKLPFSLAKLARGVLRDRKSAPTAKLAGFVRPMTGSVQQAFLTREPHWWALAVQGGRTFRISGSTNSARKDNEKGALLLVQFKDAQGALIRFEDRAFAWNASKGSSFCYVRTGRPSIFSIDIAVPAEAVQVLVGFERFAETPPLQLKLAPVVEIAPHEISADHFGLSPGSGSALLIPSLPDMDNAEKPTFGAILDEFTRDCLAPDLDLILVSKAGWREELREPRTPIAFFAESAWRGNGGQWNYAMSKPQKWGKDLDELLKWCRDSDLPTIFWNKEDPVNFDVFKTAAAKFDHIFTTDSGCVEAYKQYAGHENVQALRFAAQPLIHNPIRFTSQIDRIAFTGSWRGIKYPQRAKWLDLLLAPAMEQDLLDIFDRYADETDNPDLIFPEKFQGALRGALPYSRLVSEVYKRYLGFINVNSVEESETMLARRVFEILACGAPVISSPSSAIENTFGDVVITARTGDEAAEAIDRLRNQPFYRERLAVRGVRLVHSHHTYRHRLEQISESIGKPLVSRNRKKVSLLCCSKRPEFLKQLSSQAKRQSYGDSEIVFVAHSPDFTDDAIAEAFSGARLKILRIGPDKVLADGLNAAMDVADGDFFAKIDDDDYYGENYLADTMLAFDYAPAAGVVGKQSFFAFVQSQNQTVLRFPGNHYCYAKRVHGGTLVWSRRKTEGIAFSAVKQGTDTLFLTACRELEVPIFSSDPFNFIHVRYADSQAHTWKINDKEFSQAARSVGAGLRTESVFL